MTAKDKAKELVDMYWTLPAFVIGTGDVEYRYAKQCALICVDEILTNKTGMITDWTNRIDYWKEVKQEIDEYDNI